MIGRQKCTEIRECRECLRLKETVAKITTFYNQGKQNTISEYTTCQTLKLMEYSNRRLHGVPILSAKNRKLRRHLTQTPELDSEGLENVAWYDESQFTGLQQPPQSPDLKPIVYLWDVVE